MQTPPAESGAAASTPPLKAHGQIQFRKVSVPPHRYTPLKKAWLEIRTPIYEKMKIDIRMNLKARRVELKTRPGTPDVSNLQKCANFVHAFMLLWVDELHVESETVKGEHVPWAIERKKKVAIENLSRTRIVIADSKIHTLGSFANIKVASTLILGCH